MKGRQLLICLILGLVNGLSAKPATLEAAPYTVVKTLGNNIEERNYPAQKWVAVEQLSSSGMMSVSSDMFFSLFGYIQGANSKKAGIPMTVPVSTKVRKAEDGKHSYQMAFYIPSKFQDETPQPVNEKVEIVERKPHVYVITFNVKSTEALFEEKLKELEAYLKSNNLLSNDKELIYYYVGYNSPFETENLRNEVWIEA